MSRPRYRWRNNPDRRLLVDRQRSRLEKLLKPILATVGPVEQHNFVQIGDRFTQIDFPPTVRLIEGEGHTVEERIPARLSIDGDPCMRRMGRVQLRGLGRGSCQGDVGAGGGCPGNRAPFGRCGVKVRNGQRITIGVGVVVQNLNADRRPPSRDGLIVVGFWKGRT